MNTEVSLWAKAAIKQLLASQDKPLHHHTCGDFTFEISLLGDSLWIITSSKGNEQLGFRAAYSPDGFIDYKLNVKGDGASIKLESTIGYYQVDVNWPEAEQPVLHYKASLKTESKLCVPFWPRDIIVYGNQQPEGDIHVKQTGTRSGIIYASSKKSKYTFLYLQNLTALGTYNADTETSAGGVVGGQWPEMGLSLPPTKGKPILGGKEYVVSDAYIAFSNSRPADQFDVAKGFLTSLSNLYLLLPKPDTQYHNYLDVLPKALHDLQTNKGCWAHRSGHPYLNAYLSDYQTPPEIMVQLAVLLPIRDYMKWSGEDCNMAKEIADGLGAFYSEKLGTVMRWLPAEEHRLDGAEEQKKPLVMDSWYLHHPLLNLARMAAVGDEMAKDLLLKSVDYAIKVARHFNYVWPVFYKMDTLEVVKAETQPGKGGEKDVAGLYAHVMLQVWQITKDKKYFDEAERAAKSMRQHGFDVLYQANNTMFSAKAMILLYTETKKELYRDLAYLFLANIFKNVALWQCTYGYGKNFPTFFELFPLEDAPYTAVYEEQESYAGVHEFLSYAEGVELIPGLHLLLAEFVRYAIHRMAYYYPPMLPQDMLVKQPKTGELDPQVWVALEDLHDGWEQAGAVGQEVYGAGLAFGVVPRQFMRVPGQNFMVYVDYPVLNQAVKGNALKFQVKGDERLSCELRIVKIGDSALPTVTIKAAKEGEIKATSKTKAGILYHIKGDQSITVTWSNGK